MRRLSFVISGGFGKWRDVTENIPAIVNSMGIKSLKKWKAIFKTGHSLVLRSLYALGERTRVSQAATVRVHTKKYLCADRWGGKSRDGGSWSWSDMVTLLRGWW